MPLNASGILVHDAASGETELVDTKRVEEGENKWCSAVVVGGRTPGGVNYVRPSWAQHGPGRDGCRCIVGVLSSSS